MSGHSPGRSLFHGTLRTMTQPRPEKEGPVRSFCQIDALALKCWILLRGAHEDPLTGGPWLLPVPCQLCQVRFSGMDPVHFVRVVLEPRQGSPDSLG